MAKKVYTVQLDNKNLNTTASKAAKVEVSKSQKEVEKFGVVEINNKSAKCKVKNTKDMGYEKNVMATEKKAVKSTVSKVDDYFDFSFRPTAKVQTETRVAKEASASNNGAEIISEAKVCSAYVLTEEAKRVISIARAGSLFG